MKSGWIKLVLVASLIGFFPFACVDNCNGPCGCEPVFEERGFTVNAMAIETLYRTERNRPIDPGRFYYHEGLFKGIWAAVLVEISEEKPNQSNRSFFPSAFACSPPQSFAIEKLKDVRVFSKQPTRLNAEVTFDRNDLVNEHMALTLNFQQEYSIPGFIESNHHFQRNERIYLKCKTKPDGPVELLVDIEIELENGRSFTFTNEVLRIGPN